MGTKSSAMGHSSSFASLRAQSEAELGLEMDGRAGALVKEVLRFGDVPDSNATDPAEPTPQPAQASPSLRGVKAHSFAAIRKDLPALPKSFDWRKELELMVPPGEDPLGEQIDQGPCGSCYAFAGTMMLQMRFRVQLFKQHGILYPLELSYKSVVRCSPYTEGCSGGFSYFSARVASEIGVPLAECDKDVPAGALDQACDYACYQNASNLFFARDYFHVGGFSHGSSEESIMLEIYQNGPCELGFSTTAVPEFVRLSGNSNYPDTDVMTVILNRKTKKEPYSNNPSVHRWWYATHAILATGWGADETKWGEVKYWVVRNSWGRDWGSNGYAKMRRGNNDGAIETDASAVVPDLSRLPSGFLQMAKAHHDHQAPNRANWQAKKALAEAAKAAEAGHKGLPEYCKLRPNSPDCA